MRATIVTTNSPTNSVSSPAGSPALPTSPPRFRYLVASDFDKTLSLEDSGALLSEMLGIRGFEDKVATLSASNWFSRAASLPTYCSRPRLSRR